MKTFSLEGKCEKCGGENIGVQYCDDSYRCSYKMRHLTDGEHMHRFCPRCLYAWAESCQAPKKEQARAASADFAQMELRKRGLTFQEVEPTSEQFRVAEQKARGIERWMEGEVHIAAIISLHEWADIRITELLAENKLLRGLLEDAQIEADMEKACRLDIQEGKTK